MKGIFLVDADNTILDFDESSRESLKFAFANFGVAWQDEFAKIFFELNNRLWSSLERKEIDRDYIFYKRFPEYLRLVHHEEVDAVKFNELYLDYLKNHPIFVKGAKEFLEVLKKYGRIYIVTNGTAENQKSRFSICGLDKMVDGSFVSEIVGFDKPQKGFNDYVISHIPNFDFEKTVWIGDSLSADVKGANLANIDCIWYNPRNEVLPNWAKTVFVSDNFDKILTFLGIKKE